MEGWVEFESKGLSFSQFIVISVVVVVVVVVVIVVVVVGGKLRIIKVPPLYCNAQTDWGTG